jgi:cyclic 2,3-diphosphoglycerate synthetase
VIDGEHYPPVIEAALAELGDTGEVVGAVLAGGSEKLAESGLDVVGGVPVRAGPNVMEVLADAIDELAPDEVHDLSDEPVLDYRVRHELASVALWSGVAYRGADFSFIPPARERLCNRPSIAVIGTGKRTGKTAVGGFAARTLVDGGRSPVVVAMGRGGPPEPEILHGEKEMLELGDLIALANAGKHAASDYVEDALLARVPTVGCWRCGGGLAGGVEFSNVARGVELANELPGDVLLLEGSGSAIPPIHSDATILVVPASIPEEYLGGYFGSYRLLLADFALVTMCEDPFGSPSQISAIVSRIRRSFGSRGDIQVVRTVFRPVPTRSVKGARVYVATTAPPQAAAAIRGHLEEVHGATVVGMTHSLADRVRLREELGAGAKGVDALLCEVKAAAIDVAGRWALERGLEVVFMDNVPHGIDGDDPVALVRGAEALARERFKATAE